MIRLRIPNSILRLFFHDPQETQSKRLNEINSVIEFCKHVLNKKEKFVILDTETTGLGEKDVIIQIGIIDLNGKEILNSLVRSNKPKRISSEASLINGIKASDLKFAPLFEEIIDIVYKLSLSKTFLIFNANFDNRMFQQTIEFNNL